MKNWRAWILWGVIGVASVIIGSNLPGRLGPPWQRILIAAVAGAIFAVLASVAIWALTRNRKKP